MSFDPLPDLPASSRPMQEAMADRIGSLLVAQESLFAFIVSADFMAFATIGSFHVPARGVTDVDAPSGSGSTGPLTLLDGSGSNNMIARLQVVAPPSIDMLAYVTLHVSNRDGTQRLVTYTENVPLTYDREAQPFGITLSSAQLGGVADSEGSTLSLAAGGGIFTTLGLRDVWFARAAIGLPAPPP